MSISDPSQLADTHALVCLVVLSPQCPFSYWCVTPEALFLPSADRHSRTAASATSKNPTTTTEREQRSMGFLASWAPMRPYDDWLGAGNSHMPVFVESPEYALHSRSFLACFHCFVWSVALMWDSASVRPLSDYCPESRSTCERWPNGGMSSVTTLARPRTRTVNLILNCEEPTYYRRKNVPGSRGQVPGLGVYSHAC